MQKRETKCIIYTTQEFEEVESLKKLTESVLTSEFITDESVCEGIKDGSIKALGKFKSNLPDEAVEAAAATLVCKKAFLLRFRDVLMDACVTITHYS